MSNDALPKMICRECRYQLEKSYYFRVIAKKSDARLRKHIRLVNQKKPSNVLEKDYQCEDLDEEFEESILESYVSLTFILHQTTKYLINLIFRNTLKKPKEK